MATSLVGRLPPGRLPPPTMVSPGTTLAASPSACAQSPARRSISSSGAAIMRQTGILVVASPLR